VSGGVRRGWLVFPLAGARADLITAVGGTPVLVTSPHRPPTGYKLTAAVVLRIASADPVSRPSCASTRMLSV